MAQSQTYSHEGEQLLTRYSTRSRAGAPLDDAKPARGRYDDKHFDTLWLASHIQGQGRHGPKSTKTAGSPSIGAVEVRFTDYRARQRRAFENRAGVMVAFFYRPFVCPFAFTQSTSTTFLVSTCISRGTVVACRCLQACSFGPAVAVDTRHAVVISQTSRALDMYLVTIVA